MELRAQSDPVAGWRDIRAALRRSLDEATYSIWIEPLELREWTGDGLVLEAPPATPRSYVTVSRERDANDARTKLGEFLWRESMSCDGTWPVALEKNVSAVSKLSEGFARSRVAKIQLG